MHIQERNKFPKEKDSHLDQQINIMIQSLLPEERTKACQGASSIIHYIQLPFNREKNKSSTACPTGRRVSTLFSQSGSICLIIHYFTEKQTLSSTAVPDFHPVCCPPPGHVSLCMFFLIRVINAKIGYFG